jgi:hypothetical protein
LSQLTLDPSSFGSCFANSPSVCHATDAVMREMYARASGELSMHTKPHAIDGVGHGKGIVQALS